MAVDDIDKGSKSSDDLENVYDGIQNVETTGSNNIGDDDALKKTRWYDDLAVHKKKYVDIAAEKNMNNCKQPTESQLGAYVSLNS